MSHVSKEKALEIIELAKNIAPEGLYKHYKGDLYRVIGHCMLETSDIAGVQYHPEDDNSITWVRPVVSWRDRVIVGEHKVLRFTFVSE